jgi:hypothetical protein
MRSMGGRTFCWILHLTLSPVGVRRHPWRAAPSSAPCRLGASGCLEAALNMLGFRQPAHFQIARRAYLTASPGQDRLECIWGRRGGSVMLPMKG